MMIYKVLDVEYNLFCVIIKILNFELVHTNYKKKKAVGIH